MNVCLATEGCEAEATHRPAMSVIRGIATTSFEKADPSYRGHYCEKHVAVVCVQILIDWWERRSR